MFALSQPSGRVDQWIECCAIQMYPDSIYIAGCRLCTQQLVTTYSSPPMAVGVSVVPAPFLLLFRMSIGNIIVLVVVVYPSDDAYLRHTILLVIAGQTAPLAFRHVV